MIRQLAFDLPPVEAFRAEDYFIAGSNATAHAQITGANWPGGRMLLVGPAGAGKSHLAHLWAQGPGEGQGARVLHVQELTQTTLPELPRAVVIEDAEGAAGSPALEEALFHLWNHQTGRGLLLITARSAPRDWGLELPDLLSRMQAMPLARLDVPDDSLLAAVLVKLFGDRQVHVQPNLIPFLVARIERSVDAARRVVAALDDRALAQGRPISRAMAAEVLGADRTGPEFENPADFLDSAGISVKD